MKELYNYNNNVILELSCDELGTLVNALAEASNSVEIFETDKQKVEKAKMICRFLSKTYSEGNFERFNAGHGFY